jgi:hypothetical protein
MSSKIRIPAKVILQASCIASAYRQKREIENRGHRETEIADCDPARPCARPPALVQQPASGPGGGDTGVGKDKAGAFDERVSAREILKNLTFCGEPEGELEMTVGGGETGIQLGEVERRDLARFNKSPL